jgi:outer membrane lipoprotein-sorting protein
VAAVKRWLLVVLAAVLLVGVPVAVAHRPTGPVSSPLLPELVARAQASAAVGWSGRAQSQGSLELPDSDSFATLGQLLGERVELRAWWRGPRSWRVDRIRSTGETDTFRDGGGQVRWIFESERATFSPVSTIRLPDAVDVLPPTLGRDLLQGARADEVSLLGPSRVAGVDAAGLRLRPAEVASTVDHVDLWVDPTTGLPLRVDLYGRGGGVPVLTTAFTDVTLTSPDPAAVRFSAPADVTLAYEESTDVAAAANALQQADLPTTLAGLGTRDGQDPGAVGVYGRGPTTMIVFPLRGSVARPLRDQLSRNGASSETTAGTLAPVGPISVLLTRIPGRGGGYLLAGTVTPETLTAAAAQLQVRP